MVPLILGNRQILNLPLRSLLDVARARADLMARGLNAELEDVGIKFRVGLGFRGLGS